MGPNKENSVRVFVATLIIFLAGCASTEMKSYIGQDIREVILTNGQPIGAIEMGNGTRAFQFMWGGEPTMKGGMPL